MVVKMALITIIVAVLLWFGLSGIFKAVGAFTKAFGKELKQKMEEKDDE